ncbi:dioxygenase [Azorhizobium caulinodans ORS 571]|uniref:Dioxygenase n=1 Tax=Azorhizobium caulinodans (strain ATCC 43989 / DSM 5975 / JCM 20966 / LMG 6465 / NBRC 14845 / NCIMB 13405 / ORS 571) TaxID=438753 RepID=A8I1S2_AZOC5|nr:intradiol ring-cleavage dioxygenase [Azorhizobium caulinodans]BAF87412.1 dioxygenase [Azorhizobium caulinodans ORS 571]
MRNFDQFTITQAVLERVANTPDARTRQISEALVRHLHDFIREVRPTQAEWEQGIAFLTATGHMCTGTRQEFILLSDTLGVSMLVDAINHDHQQAVTESTVLGPFYVEGPPEQPCGSDISGDLPGEPMFASGTVRTADGTPLANAIVDVWHSDEDGYYDVQHEGEGLVARARFRTDEAGHFHFWSIKPAAYPIPHDGPVGKMLQAQGRHPWRPAHVHFMIEAPGYEKLVTHVFVAGDAYLDSDAVFGVKDSLICDFAVHPAGAAPDGRVVDRPWCELTYDFRLNPVSNAASRAA